MACETPYRLPTRAIPGCDAMIPAHPRIAATCRAKVIVAKRSETKPLSEPVAKGVSSRRAARIAEEREMAALCQRRAALWADAIRKGLDPDIARFIRDQAAAWRLLESAYASSVGDPSIGPPGARGERNKVSPARTAAPAD